MDVGDVLRHYVTFDMSNIGTENRAEALDAVNAAYPPPEPPAPDPAADPAAAELAAARARVAELEAQLAGG